MKIKVAIADAHPIFREGLKIVLSYLKNIECVGVVENGKELLSLINEISVDVIFIDIKIPIIDGFEASMEIIKSRLDTKIIVITSSDDIESVIRMIEIGVNSYVLKDADFSEIEKAINTVMNNKSYISSQVLIELSQYTIQQRREMNRKNSLPEITDREKELLQLLCEGLSKKEIAEKMFVCERTIEKYKERLMEKTNTNTTVKLILYALKNKITKITFVTKLILYLCTVM